MAEAVLREKCGLEIRLEIIRTCGDERATSAGRKGMFTTELERALVEKRIDVAVHSAKDLPSEMHNALAIAAVLPRGGVEDVLITKQPALCSVQIIGTGSVRRQHQLRWLKKPREVVDLRGNVPTRLRKFALSDWDGIVLARAGLERLGFSPPEFDFEQQNFFVEILPIEQFVPAGGQGIIALQTRAEDAVSIAPIDHRETHLCLRAERELLRLLEGDCNLPVGAHACWLNGKIELRVQLFEEDEEPRMATRRGVDPCRLANLLFETIQHEHREKR